MDEKGLAQKARLDAIFPPGKCVSRPVFIRELVNRTPHGGYHEHPDVIHHFALCTYYSLVYHRLSFTRHHYCSKLDSSKPECPYTYLECPCRKYGQLVIESQYRGGVIEG